MKWEKRQGFTLLEILTAVAIMLILCGFVFKISSQVLATWGRASQQLDSGNEMKLVLDVIERDLETSLPYYWMNNIVKGEFERVERLCFYSYCETDIQNIIIYEISDCEVNRVCGIYRYVRECNKKYDVTEGLEAMLNLEKMQISSAEMVKASNLLARNVKGLSVKFFYRDAQGKMQWTMRAPFSGTAICVDVEVIGNKGEDLSRRMTLVGVTRL